MLTTKFCNKCSLKAQNTQTELLLPFANGGHLPHGLHGNLCRLPFWVAVHTGRNARECHLPAAVLLRQLQRAHITRAQFFRFAAFPAVPHRPHGMNEVCGGRTVAAGNFGLTGFTAAQGAALGQ